MKKENVVKKILLHSLVGVSVGVTLLMLAYVGVYFLVGNALFIQEITQLQDIHIFIFQILSSGIAGYILFINLNSCYIIQDKPFKKHPYKTIFKFVLILLASSLAIVIILSNTKIFSDNISMMNIIILAIVSVSALLILSIKSIKDNLLVKKFNQKVKERNS